MAAMLEDTNFEDDDLASMSTDDVVRASRLLDTEIRILKVSSLFSSLQFVFCLNLWFCWFLFLFFLYLKEESQRTNLELESYKEKIKENQEKIKLNKQLPYLVGNIVEVFHSSPILLVLNSRLFSYL